MDDQKTINMTYEEAMAALRNGYLIRLPEWTGCWTTDGRQNTLVITKGGDILETPWTGPVVEDRTDWQIIPGLGFDWALNALKNGKAVRRTGWNGKGMFIFLRPGDLLTADFIIDKVKSLPQSVKDYYVAQFAHTAGEADRGKGPAQTNVEFTPYLCMKAADGTIVNGWLASQTDMLAEDWELAV